VVARDLAGTPGSAVSATSFAIADTAATLAVSPRGPLARVELASPSPAPAIERATIVYELPSPARVRLTLLDLQGREVRVLENTDRSGGEYRTIVQTSGLRSGVYLVRLQAGGADLHRRMIVVH